jgi:hypothetical protein
MILSYRSRRFASALMAAASTLLLGCPRPMAPKTISLRMEGSPSEATVTVDDIYIGRLDFVTSRGIALPVGPHRISVEAPGYLPWDKLVEAKTNSAPIRLVVRLVPIPD